MRGRWERHISHRCMLLALEGLLRKVQLEQFHSFDILLCIHCCTKVLTVVILIVGCEHVVIMQQCVLLGDWKASLASCRRHPGVVFFFLAHILQFCCRKIGKMGKRGLSLLLITYK